jgi:hypothetical protein
MMNPETNMFEEVKKADDYEDAVNALPERQYGRVAGSMRYKTVDGKPVPKDAIIFEIGEKIEIRGYVFQVERFDGSEMVLRGVGLALKPRIVNRVRKKSRGASKKKRKSGNPKHK